MRIVSIIFMVLMVNLSLSFFAISSIIPHMSDYATINSTETFDTSGKPINNDQSMSYKLQYYLQNKEYSSQGLQSTNSYLQAGGDFLLGLNIFYEIFVKGVVLVKPTLDNFGIPSGISWLIIIPIYFLYGAGLIEFIANRQLMPED